MLYAIADRIVDDYLAVIDGVAVDIERGRGRGVLGRELQPGGADLPPQARGARVPPRGHAAHRADAAALPKQAGLPLDPRTEEYFRDVHDHLLRDAERIAGFDELLNSALQANLAQVTMRDNQDMRKISAWVAIIAVPTMVFGVYGMNFEHMPELQWTVRLPGGGRGGPRHLRGPLPQVQAHRLALSIVTGSIEDIDSLEPLWVAVHHAHAASMPELAPYVSDAETWAHERPLYEALLAKPDTLLLLARDGEELVGYALAHVTAVRGHLGPRHLADGTADRRARIARGRRGRRGEGIGSALLDAVERDLAALGVDDLILGVLPGNQGARRLYERRGFRPTWLYLSRFAGR